MIDLLEFETWLALPILGMIMGKTITLGDSDEIRIIQLSHLDKGCQTQLSEKLIESFASWGLDYSNDLLLNKPQLLLISIDDSSCDTIRDALIYSDLALTILNKKLYGFGLPQFVQWDRRGGSAVGAIYKNSTWKPLLRPSQTLNPAIRNLEKDSWDGFLSKLLQSQLNSEIEQSLLSNLQWEREALMSPNDTHRFAFEWVALESGMIEGERSKGDFVKRLGLLANAPRGADSLTIMKNPAIFAVFHANQNPYSNTWKDLIEEMYECRCNILHEGATEVTSIEIEPLKIDWFYPLAKYLNARLQQLLQYAISQNILTLKDMWNFHAISFMYSKENPWIEAKNDGNLVKFDWSQRRYPN